jgi:peptidoglycan/xylan/chitin deacetylase (PgdA/CDA1 family)
VYHGFIDTPREVGRFVVGLESSARQMNRPQKQGYQAIALRDLIGMRRATEWLTEKLVVITVDDGYRDFLGMAAPVLRQHHCAPFFVVTERPGAGDAADSHPPLSRDEIKTFITEGCAIGANTMNHPRPTELPARKVAREIDGSRETIPDKACAMRESLAYPYGDHDSDIGRRVAAGGLSLACTVDEGLNHPAIDDSLLRRTRINGQDSVYRFAFKVCSGLNRIKLRQIGRLIRSSP